MLNEGKMIRIGGSALAISGDLNQDWFIGWSPSEKSMSAEGQWEDWVNLAQAILDVDESRQPETERKND